MFFFGLWEFRRQNAPVLKVRTTQKRLKFWTDLSVLAFPTVMWTWKATIRDGVFLINSSRRVRGSRLLVGLASSIYPQPIWLGDGALQFIISPHISSLSDKYGRKRVQLITLLGDILFALVWIQLTTFASYMLSRIIEGLSEGNVQLAIAILSDITSAADRSKAL